ncbi:Ribose 1,5-bisphosphate phosphokinase PhnN [Pseudomonas fluorescens]|uniref:phosphonate metabolism protein/1,5-bisphosphokinase (PRPP-forming) PhnN n=1 Tax=Pseudomonas fluorescens TaxID=294 RepID=UPI001256E20A|nr:phosphonate metabolism protein/1,5-bisphosphokinase (PRPP-forming) PhnN [Pseudomonas fluorescens]CAG8867825.1 Ribose 1,5-bisphosphate phosphokinase PhnN [Pseudomonas fluorescens]VVP81887.1 Ribose 1,5-bisphosphate phosphokinase PhnN [Pseudomonas fluorescens]
MQHDASARGNKPCIGRLIYLMGPSGAGKDSLIDASRAQLLAAGAEVARRVITRSAEAKGEDAVSVSVEEFARLRATGALALDWQANGLAYGIPASVDDWLGEGRHVLVNGSRAYLRQARARYPDLIAIQLEVDPRILQQRLLARGREPVRQIEERLERGRQLQVTEDDSVHILDNSGSLKDAAQGLFRILREQGVQVR